MLKTTAKIFALTICLAVQNAQAETAAAKGERIAKQAAARASDFVDSSARAEMQLISRGGAKSIRRFTSRSLQGSGRTPSANLIVFEFPGDVRNTALLTHAYDGASDDQWLYLPAMGRVKRISSSARSGSFMGSEFAYEDMVDQNADEFTHVWIEDRPCPDGGGTCHVLDRTPRKRGSGYSMQRVWMDSKELLPRQIHYFDRGGKHLKTLSVTGYRKLQGRYWRAGTMMMRNLLTGKSTRLLWSDHQFGIGLSPRDFSPQALKRRN